MLAYRSGRALLPESAALEAAGANPQVATDGTVLYARGDDALVIIVAAGDRPTGTGVHTRNRLVLRAPFPGPAATWVGETGRKTHAFVRLDEGCFPLGRLGGFYRGPREVTRTLTEPLTPEELALVRPPAAETLPPIDWVSSVPDDPIAALRGFLTGWYADIPTAAPDVVEAPPPLAAYFEAAAGRHEVLDTLDELLPPDQWRPDSSGLQTFAVAHQGVWTALFDPAEPDPPVWYWGMAAELLPERSRLSGFLLQFALCQAALCSPVTVAGEIAPDQLEVLLAPLTRIPLPPSSHPADVTHYYVGPGLVIGLMEYPDGRFEVFGGSRRRSPVRPLRALDVDWDALDD
ncbi:hypothetical protein [Actinoplanes sp. HUAS TT8]|uniref:hypothetical protein n=1 Tax=Actinoplanes sp. HUAS TT8 TaxID=3447453 RepID=UPI003F521FB9